MQSIFMRLAKKTSPSPHTAPISKGKNGSLFCLLILALFNSCDPWYAPLSVYTVMVTDVLDTEATGGGDMAEDRRARGAESRGVCWSTNPVPTLSDSHTSDTPGGGPYKSSMTGLTPNTTYNVRAYATGEGKLVYGKTLSFKTTPPLTPSDRQSILLNKMWRCITATLNGVQVTGYNQFKLLITDNSSAINFTASGRPSGVKSSPWMPNGTFAFGPDPVTLLVRQPDNLSIAYTVTNALPFPTVGMNNLYSNADKLEMKFTYTGAGFDGRVGDVAGAWVFTFYDN